ncbi:amino acid ABC transporter permease [Celeribacter neptunius]|uniref:L-glutamine ABC transporter membrane protein/L-glutamate ABC transporter membrane protein/L-aspartate ABC transporter membrane protein/L-asparagine ABC transporter membrane protein n=1 Tax=Celeribacter neptunius TaxID=588602 RepID=A0A1I3RBX5_9RHOB|nr:amino acid ABC transporter permease [Celeribacter neptunius]SFJ44073.1 L-glutamine ABC transporter membrane protein/L-glutamate ABC transporter membrane protein/L-aspartate ABC transporter membrane protein/L-asparagine ABC transporter membrane protein [Celeribacter neptunius]
MSSQNTPLAYVRKEMLEQQPAPRGQVGVAKWMRENLFSGWFNTALTLVSIYVIYSLLKAVLPWAFGGVWTADSLQECRTILNDLHGNTHYACWAVINERWNQIVYGTFFPSSEYWRTHIAFVLLILAILPVLFDALPRKMLWITAVYPFLMVWLIWGGTIWGPVSVALGFVLAYMASQFAGRSLGSGLTGLIAVAVALIWWFFIGPSVTSGLNKVLPLLHLQEIQSRELGGFVICVIIGVSGIALSLPIGIVLALGRQSDLLIVKTICVGFIEFIRGVPLITLLFTASLLLNYFLPPGTEFDLTLRVIVMVTLFSSAYMAEVIRGGLAALPKGQYEAADALGLDYWKAQRLIIMPQALKISIPGIVNTFIGLFKDTTLVFFIGIFDMLAAAQAIRANSAWNGITWELYIFIGLIFWICCFAMSRYSQWLERKLRTDHR